MIAMIVRGCLRLALVLLPMGCGAIPLGPWGGPAYSLDTNKLGTGEQAISPRNDPFYSDGQAMDYRRR